MKYPCKLQSTEQKAKDRKNTGQKKHAGTGKGISYKNRKELIG